MNTHGIIIYLENFNYFQYPTVRQTVTNSTDLKDIHDGQAFEHMMHHGFLSNSNHTGLIVSADGVPVFKSNQGSLWPVYLTVTSLAPEQRMLMKNIIIAALWYGPTKPPMNLLLGPICNCIQSLSDEGIPVTVDGALRIIRPKLLLGVFDLPARASATNTIQFNGKYGCLYCIDEGVIQNRTRIYPPDAPHKLRSTNDMINWAATADVTGTAQFGVKGSCALAKSIEFPTSVPIDYMHSVLEGVFKSLMNRWFQSKFHGELYSLRRYCPLQST